MNSLGTFDTCGLYPLSVVALHFNYLRCACVRAWLHVCVCAFVCVRSRVQLQAKMGHTLLLLLGSYMLHCVLMSPLFSLKEANNYTVCGVRATPALLVCRNKSQSETRESALVAARSLGCRASVLSCNPDDDGLNINATPCFTSFSPHAELLCCAMHLHVVHVAPSHRAAQSAGECLLYNNPYWRTPVAQGES